MWKTFIVFVTLLAVAAMLYLPAGAPGAIFNTPDESANYFFASLLAKQGELRVKEPLEAAVDNAIHPRGVNVIDGFLVPESFLGLPLLYGATIRFAPRLVPILTSLLTFFALLALYGFFHALFKIRTARLASLFAASIPVLLYFGGRPFMHNVLFLDLFIISLWLLEQGVGPPVSTKWDPIAGLAMGAAVMVRTSEAAWVAFAAVLLLAISRKRFPLRVLKFAFGAFLVLGPLLLLNRDLYGNFFHAGYSVTESNLVAEGGDVPQLAHSTLLSQLLLPFGFHPLEAARRFIRYALGAMWWYTVPMMLGVILLWRSWYARAWLLVSLYLILSYGSFAAEVFADPKHPLAPTIGSPYLRYWLPIFVFGAPFVAEFFLWLRHAMNKKLCILYSTFCILIVALSLRAVIWHGPEAWLAIKDNLLNFSETRERVVRTTQESAVFLIPRWADRILFPARRVIVDMEGKDPVAIVQTLRAQGLPVFWLRGRGEIPLERPLREAGFKLDRRFDLDPKGKVYEIVK